VQLVSVAGDGDGGGCEMQRRERCRVLMILVNCYFEGLPLEVVPELCDCHVPIWQQKKVSKDEYGSVVDWQVEGSCRAIAPAAGMLWLVAGNMRLNLIPLSRSWKKARGRCGGYGEWGR
jgi:hypothetical protein